MWWMERKEGWVVMGIIGVWIPQKLTTSLAFLLFATIYWKFGATTHKSSLELIEWDHVITCCYFLLKLIHQSALNLLHMLSCFHVPFFYYFFSSFLLKFNFNLKKEKYILNLYIVDDLILVALLRKIVGVGLILLLGYTN